MSRELWAEEACKTCGGSGDKMEDSASALGIPGGWVAVGPCPKCAGSGIVRQPLDFDAIWDRFYKATNRKFESGLTYNELWFVVYGEKKEEK